MQDFQSRHPQTVVVAMNVLESDAAVSAIQKLVTKQKLEALRIATGAEWQKKFRLTEQIPVTLVVYNGKVGVMHDSVMADPVSFLEADVKAIGGCGVGIAPR
jgi:hypothetical protein